NANGLLREFFPKKFDLNTIDQAELECALDLINHRPRKCLGWKTSHEAIMDELSHLACQSISSKKRIIVLFISSSKVIFFSFTTEVFKQYISLRIHRILGLC